MPTARQTATTSARPVIALAGDDRYLPGLLVSLVSALATLPVHAATHVVIIDDGLSATARSAIHSVVRSVPRTVSIQIASGASSRTDGMPISGHYTATTYGRLLLPELCGDSSIALYLDSDTLTRRSVWELLVIGLDGEHSLAAVVDADVRTRSDRRRYGELQTDGDDGIPYINAGVLVLDLVKWRADDLGDAVMRYIREHGEQLRFVDQDAINAVVGENTALLDRRWNYQLRVERSRRDTRTFGEAAILHFSDVSKPWMTLEWLRQGPVARQAGLAWWRVAVGSSHLPSRFRIDMALSLVPLTVQFARTRITRQMHRVRQQAARQVKKGEP